MVLKACRCRAEPKRKARGTGYASADTEGLMVSAEWRQGTKRRPIWFHWVANMALIVMVGLPGLVPAGDDLWLMLAIVPVAGLLIIPVTRRWERSRPRSRAGSESDGQFGSGTQQ